MKANKNIMVRKVVSGLMAVSILFMFNQCVQEYEEVKEVAATITPPSDYNHSNIIEDDGNSAPITEEAEVVPPNFSEQGDTVIARTATSVGLKNFEQIDASFSALTGIPRSNNNVRSAYNDNFLGLPGNNAVKENNASKVMAIFKVASAYCVEAANSNSQLFQGFNLGQASGTALGNNAGKMALVDAVIAGAWGQGVEDGETMSMSRNELSALIDELLQGQGSSAQTTRRVAAGVCAAALSSPQVIYL